MRCVVDKQLSSCPQLIFLRRTSRWGRARGGVASESRTRIDPLGQGVDARSALSERVAPPLDRPVPQPPPLPHIVTPWLDFQEQGSAAPEGGSPDRRACAAPEGGSPDRRAKRGA